MFQVFGLLLQIYPGHQCYQQQTQYLKYISYASGTARAATQAT